MKEHQGVQQRLGRVAQAEIKAGKTVDRAAADLKVPARYKGYTASVGGSGGPKPNTEAVCDALRK